MKILYIGVYRDGTGWSRMAIESMMSLHAAGVDVTARPVKQNKNKVNLPIQVLGMEAKPDGQTFDVVIQNVLPHSFDFCGKIGKNIGYYCTETDSFQDSGWVERINCMDIAWVPHHDGLLANMRSGVIIPTEVVPIATDIKKYQHNYKPLSIRDKLSDSFIFYYIGDWNKRKDIASIIRAFHTEFDVNEPVNLVIKTTPIDGLGANAFENAVAQERIRETINEVKDAMKLYPSVDQYKQEIILVGLYSDEEIIRLHASCDCFVCPSHAEAWCLPAFDAMAMGKTPIVTGYGGFREFIDDTSGWLLPYNMEPVFAMTKNTFPKMYTGRENWAQVKLDNLRTAMREAYEDTEKRKAKATQGMKKAYEFTYDKVGKLMLEALK